MAKQLNVNLSMTADTSQAKAQLQQLKNQLTELTKLNSISNDNFALTKEIQDASTAAAQLKVQLTAATDVNTGKLDLSKFSQQLNQSGMSIDKYYSALTSLGPAGEKAFATLASSIQNADARLGNANSALAQFATTLKNTARWQISSSILHGFMSTLSSAYSYAQDLNKSLNDIRIVTGESEEQMAKFAAQANKAAQSLSSTTTAYTNAALIFYQQGLDDEAVKERTDTVIKMSNVTGDSAEDVSSYMTAIWENFADGSKSLEYYADVITRLGADTAASSAEIAEGIESFASIGETIGLSYEYATSALTTIVAKTRASASEVGNGLRTIFSRLQNLSLGETLDDGTDLTKYSKALETVGVNIKDASGELKDMDTILEDLAGKWDTLDQAEKVALANTVGGVRQYTKLISLMDNWDFMEQNLASATNSEGSLQEQADIYAESWEAAQKRVKASAQAIYDALLDDNFFIELNNGFSGFLDIINETIKGLGGLKGVLLTIGAIITQVYQKDIANAMANMGTGLMMLTKKGQEKVESLRTEANDKLINNAFNDGTLAGSAKASAYKAQGAAQQTLLDNARKMSEEQRNIAQLLLDQNKQLGEEAIKQADIVKSAEEEAIAQRRILELRNGLSRDDTAEVTDKAAKNGAAFRADAIMGSNMETIVKESSKVDMSKLTAGLSQSYKMNSTEMQNFNKEIGTTGQRVKSSIIEMNSSVKSLKSGFTEMGTTAQDVFGEEVGKAFDKMASAFAEDENGITVDLESLKTGWQEWEKAVATSDNGLSEALDTLADKIYAASEASGSTDPEVQAQGMADARAKAEALVNAYTQLGSSQVDLAGKSGTVVTNFDKIKQKMAKMSQQSISMSKALTQISSTIMSVGMVINSVVGLIDVWKDDEADLTTKLTTTLTTLGMLVPTIMSVVKGFGTAQQAVTIFGIKTSLAMWQVTLIAAAIAGLIAIFALLAKAEYEASPEGVFKSAAAAAEDAKTAAEEVKQAYDDLQDSLENLETGLDKIDGLTRGTLEWREAIIESNQNLIDLLSTYRMLNSANFTVDEDGIMRLAEGVEKQLNEAAINALEQANVAKYGAEMFVNSASSRNDASEAAEDITIMRSTGESSYDVVGSNTQISADIGMAIAEAMNSGALADLTDSDAINKAISSINGLTDAEKDSVAQQIASNQELQDSMSELATTVAQNTAANDVLAQQIIDSEFGDKIDNAGLTDEEASAVGQVMGDALEQTTNDLYESKWKDKGLLGGGITDEEVQKKYAKAKGWATDTIDNQSGNKAKYYKKDGTEVGVISDEVARKYLAQQEALEQLGEGVNAYIADVEEMVQNGDKIAKGVGNELLSFAGGSGGSFGNLTKKELDKVKDNIDASVDEDGILTEDTFKIGDITVNEEYVQQLGYESVQAYYDAIQAALTNGEEAFDIEAIAESWGIESATGAVFNTVGDHFNALFDNNALNLSKMTSGAMENFSTAYKNIFDEGGEEALDYVDQILKASGKKANEVATLIGEVDWSSWDSIQKLGSKVTALGVEIDTNLITQLAQATNATKEFSTDDFCTQLANITEILNGLNTGDTISSENYESLGEGYEDYFMLMADGTYKLIGQAEAFHDAVMADTTEDLKTKTEELNASREAIQAQLDAANEALGGKDLSSLSTSQNKYNADTDKNSYNGTNVSSQLDFLEQMGYSIDQINAWRDDLADGNTTVETLNAIGEAVAETATEYNNLQTSIDTVDAELEEAQEAYASTAEHFSELDQMLAEGTISAEAYTKAWTAMDNENDMAGLDADEVEEYADALEDVYKEQGLTSKGAQKMAQSIMRMNRGVEDLADNFDDYADVLKNSSRGSQEYAKALSSLKDDVSDLTNVSTDYISEDFITDHLEEIEKAATGDAEAIDQLRQEMAKSIIASIIVENGLDDEQTAAIWDAWSNLETGLSDIDVGVTLDGENEFVNALNEMIAASGMTASQVNELLSSMGFETNFATETEPTKQVYPVTRTITEVSGYTSGTTIGPDGDPIDWQYPILDTQTLEVDREVKEGEVTAFAMSTDGSTPKINSITRTSSGASNNYSSSNAGGSSPSKSSGSGGSSKSTEHNDEDYKDYTDEKERYHVIKNQLEDLTSQYDRISKAKDKAFGTARLANLNKEIAAQKKLTQANKQYLDEIESYLAQDKGTMASYGAIFDNNGTILNYDELVKSQVDAYNSAVDTYNAAYTDDEGAKAAFEAAQERYDDFQDALDQYEETQDLFNEQTQTYIDSLNAERELLLERTQLQVELKVNVEEDALNFLEYALDNIENKAYDCAEAFGYLNDMTAAYLGTAKAYEEGLRSLFANQGLSDADFDNFINGNSATFNTLSDMLSNGESAGFQSEDVETIREYIQELISANENLQEVRQTVHDQILTVWDEWNEKLDDGISKLEHLQAIQESYVNIIDIVGQKNLGVSNAFMRKLAQQGIDQANDKLIAEKARYDALKQARDDAYATFEEQKNKGILSEEEIKIWEDSLQQMDEDVQSASEDFQSAWEDALTSIGEAFEAEVDRIIEAYDDAAAGLMSSVSQLQEAFDRKSDLADQYLDDYEKIYQFSKLNRDIENSIDSTDNVKAKKELLELQSKINAYEEAGTDISEYELQQLQKEYELKKAQIELEESQEAKSQVKMQRDSEGNYSYVYTANDEDVSKAEQNYEDKLHDLQQLNAEYINDLQSNMIQMEQDCQDKVQEILKDSSLTQEERLAQINELIDYYNEKQKFYISEAELWEQNSQTLYEQDWKNYAEATGYKISAEDEWLDHWDETQLALLTGFDNLEDYQTNHNMNVANLLLASGEAFSTWQTNIEEAMNNAGTSMGTFEEDATENLNSVAEESETTKDQIVTDSEDMVNAVEDVMDAVARWEDDYSQTVQNMINKNKLLVQSFNSLIAAWSEYKVSAAANDSDSSSSSSGSGSGNGSGSGSSSGSGSGSGSGSSSDNSDKVEGVAAAIWMDGSSTSGWGTGATRRQRFQEKGVSDAQAYINAHASNGDIYSAWASRRDQLKKYYYGSFDTGGYTGEWGVDGKLALLHEKELVLNADDTANFLQAIDVVRQISDMIDLNALSSAGGLSSLFAATTSGSDQNLQQEVHITAEFPNATDKNQITEAFNDIINLASQYANRK